MESFDFIDGGKLRDFKIWLIAVFSRADVSGFIGNDGRQTGPPRQEMGFGFESESGMRGFQPAVSSSWGF